MPKPRSRAQAKAGLTPAEAAAAITAGADIGKIDFETMRVETELVGINRSPLPKIGT